ncbi:Glycerophosphoryl diester phosphodiesterase [Pseudoalteromonas sp. THAF3]|uniref:glycerophosphodiester phosphodiesterase n=1 Tax=Pseudoalteromonas sp. THAF3 TaxID=2587843 RepID=UPI001268C3E0|nr:glycerophosphodiester phosphodiesterase family protein [Pseudoalteromonas sp. THAF3]QFU03828.1 Glycerophosphoryl diester phosphodiesterase [Pseudoalteromonas sp. THAF3]
MKVFAHRGASGNHPENTQIAIESALSVGVDGIEVDLQSCLDDYVIIHDTWLDRTTSGQGKVNKTPLAEIQRYDAGQGQRVPGLQDMIDWIGNKTLLNLELKHTFSLDKLVATLEHNVQQGLLQREQLIVSSFDHHQLVWLKQHLPWVKIGALTSSIPLNYAEFAQRLHAYSLHLDKNFVNHEFVADAKQRGLEVYAYTVDKKEDILDMRALGVDGIFTNYPCNTKMILANDA